MGEYRVYSILFMEFCLLYTVTNWKPLVWNFTYSPEVLIMIIQYMDLHAELCPFVGLTSRGPPGSRCGS